MSDKLTIDDEIAINAAITKAIGVGNGYYAPTECDADDATEAVIDYLKSRLIQPVHAAETVEACANTKQLLHNLQTEIDIVQDGQNPKLTSVLRAAKSVIRAQSITPSADAELMAQNIANEMDDEKSGFWRSCSGCHEHNEGVPTGPMSKIFRCNLGTGCSECGGIGVVWDNLDYSALATKEPTQ